MNYTIKIFTLTHALVLLSCGHSNSDKKLCGNKISTLAPTESAFSHLTCTRPLRFSNLEFTQSTVEYDETTSAPAERLKDQAQKQNDFAFELYRNLASANPSENIFFSPLSVRNAFALLEPALEPGALATTELEKVLRFENNSDLHEELKGNILQIKNAFSPPGPGSNLKINLVNQLFVDKSLGLQAPFLDLLKKFYNIGVGKADFKSSDAKREESRLAINDFVEQQTGELITDLLPADALSKKSSLVVTNAIHMLADWQTPFGRNNTSVQEFMVLENGSATPVNVSMMHQEASYLYTASDMFQAASIPYVGNKVAMLIILPSKDQSLEKVTASLDGSSLGDLISKLSSQRLDLALPQLDFEWGSRSLKKPLQQMGMDEVFKDTKNHFPKLFTQANGDPFPSTDAVFIGDVFHKARIKLDEKGTEAAAATAIAVATASSALPSDPIKFEVNRPFLLFVYEKTNQNILFMGRITDPR